MWGRNCSEIVTSGDTFVLTLNRASALKVEGNEQHFLLPLHIVATMLVLTYNFATAITETTTLKLCTLSTTFQLVSSFQNCELKQEPRTLSTELQQTHEFHGYGKTRTLHTVNRAATNSRIPRSRKKQEPAHCQPSFANPSNSTIVKESIFSHQQGWIGIVQK